MNNHRVVLTLIAVFVAATAMALHRFGGRVLAYMALALAVTASYIKYTLLVFGSGLASGDISIYANELRWVRVAGIGQYVTSYGNEAGYAVLSWIVGQMTADERWYILTIGTVGISVFAIGAVRLVGWFGGGVVLVAYLNFALFESYLMVALRQGVAFCMVVLGLSAIIGRIERNRGGRAAEPGQSIKATVGGVIVIALAPLIHTSAVVALPVAAIVWMLRVQTSLLKTVAFVCGTAIIVPSLLYATGYLDAVGTKIDVFMSDEALRRYGRQGVRYDLIVTISAAIAFLAVPVSNLLYRRYAALCGCVLFFFCAYIPFSMMAYNDRVAAYAVLMVPLVGIARGELLAPAWKAVYNGAILVTTAVATIYVGAT